MEPFAFVPQNQQSEERQDTVRLADRPAERPDCALLGDPAGASAAAV
jgi:hypothetical protein